MDCQWLHTSTISILLWSKTQPQKVQISAPRHWGSWIGRSCNVVGYLKIVTSIWLRLLRDLRILMVTATALSQTIGMPVTRKTCSCRILAMTQLVTSGPVQTPLPLLPLPLFTVSQAVLRLAAPRPFSCPCSRWQIKQLHKACTARPVCKCEKCDFCLFCKYAIFSFFQVWATVQATSTSLTKQSSFMVDVMTQNMESR